MFESLRVVLDALFELVELRLDLRPVEEVKTVLIVFLYCGLVVAQSLLILAQFIVALAGEVPVVTYDLRVGTLVGRIQLNGHREIRYSASEFSSALIHTSTVMVCDTKVYQAHIN